jgi:hypothetical protein
LARALAPALLRCASVPSPLLAQRVSDLLRELNLLVCGADHEELQHILAAVAATEALATARLREERGLLAARATAVAAE